jgi:excisionase family DNA binding protein
MTHRRTIRAAAPALRTADEDKLARLIRAIARQAAQQAYKAFINALDRPLTSSGAPSDPTIPQGRESEGTTSEAGQGIGSDERFFSVAEIADQLGLSQKSVRRKIAKGELIAIRIGKLRRIGERSRAAYIARARLSNDNKK